MLEINVWIRSLLGCLCICWLNTASGMPIHKEADDLCSNARQIREELINVEPEISLQVSLRDSGQARCFSPAENLFFVALIAAQKELGQNAPWYKQLGIDNRAKSEHACQILGYDQSPFGKSMAQCVHDRFSELMKPYSDKYRNESAAYINKRNARAEILMKQCLSVFYRKLPELPRSIYFPLAYYDRKIHSYPDWYIEEKMKDSAWLQNMGSARASDILAKAVGDSCPGDMIWWLYMQP